ncbi:MAG: hypothetical protein JNG84_02540, partial [Archangium sp.]|nr:hypothetical protein [Archangium sp.]
GEISVLTNGPATATVTAAGPVLTLRLPAKEFNALVLRDPVASLAVKRIAKERLARTAQFDEAQAERPEPELVDDARV